MHIFEQLEKLYGLFNKKTGIRRSGLNNSIKGLKTYLSRRSNKQLIWFHCASLGEFFQAEPLIKRINQTNDFDIILSFYSPSGYQQRSEYDQVDFVFYLPTDTRKNAVSLTQWIKPDLVVFAKYEFWFNYLNQLQKNGSSVVFISTIFRKDHYLFQFPMSSFSISILQKVNMFFVQDHASVDIAVNNKINHVLQTGDTRIDAVIQNSKSISLDEKLIAFTQGAKIFVIGSSWSKDDEIYKDYLIANPSLKVIIAPHEINKHRIEQLSSIFDMNFSLYSEWNSISADKQILIIDNIGMLSSLYSLADVVYIGGGFGAGIHNTLEPAVFKIPLVFGPKYMKFEEAKYFIKNGLARSVKNRESFVEAMDWAMKEETLSEIEKGMNSFFMKNKNSSQRIFDFLIKENLLLLSNNINN